MPELRAGAKACSAAPAIECLFLGIQLNSETSKATHPRCDEDETVQSDIRESNAGAKRWPAGVVGFSSSSLIDCDFRIVIHFVGRMMKSPGKPGKRARHRGGRRTMITNYPTLLAALRKLASSNEDGFEGLVRDCLALMCKRTIRLKKSGPQGGSDMVADKDVLLPHIQVEAKRFGLNTKLPLDELKAKLGEVMDDDLSIDVWALALSREMKEPDWSQLESIAAKKGVSLLCLDWRDAPGTLPPLAVVCASAPEICEARLDMDVSLDLANIAAHQGFDALRDEIVRKLNAPEAGWDIAAMSARDWLEETLSSKQKARKRLHSDAKVLGDAIFVRRPKVEAALTNWQQTEPTKLAAILGDEGRGKTWATLHWCEEQSKREAAPMCLVVSAKDVAPGEAHEVIAQVLHGVMPLANIGVLGRRVRRWLTADPKSTGRRVLLIVDGLNERWDFAWSKFAEAFTADELGGRVSVLLTSRRVYWQDDLMGLKSLDPEPVVIDVPEFSDAERDDLLVQHGIDKKSLREKLLDLMRIPRFASLAIALRDKLEHIEDLSIARLVLEDWRARLARTDTLKVDDEGLLAFVAKLGEEVRADNTFTISAKAITERLGADSGEGKDYYRGTIDELVSGLWLEKTGKPHQYKVNDALLPYAIGLDLGLRLENAADGSAASNIIADYEEQLNGADYGARILRAATTIALIRNKTKPEAKRALVNAWLEAKNFSPQDFQELWPIVTCDPDLFFELADKHFIDQPVRREHGEVLIKALANASRWANVRTLLIKRLPNWVAGVGQDPVAWHFGQSKPEDERIKRTADNRALWLEAEKNYPRKLSAQLVERKRDHRAEAAFSILSFVKRAPFIEVLLLWVLARSIMGFEVGYEALNWICRRNREDDAELVAALKAEIATLRSFDNAVANRVADGLERAMALPGVVAPTVAPKGPPDRLSMAGNGELVWSKGTRPPDMEAPTLVAHLSKFAANPDAWPSEADEKMLREWVSASIASKEMGNDELGPAVPIAVSRWAPKEGAALTREALSAAIKAGNPPDRLERYLLIFGDDERAALAELATKELEASTNERDAKNKKYLQRNAAVIGLIGRSAAEQIAAIANLDEFSFSQSVAQLMAPLGADDFRQVLKHIDGGTLNQKLGWLSYLNIVDLPDVLPPEAMKLVALTKHDNEAVRGQAIVAISATNDSTLGKAFVASAWSYQPGQKREEAIFGTYLLAIHGVDEPFEAIRARIVPQGLAYLIKRRGLRAEELNILLEETKAAFAQELSGKVGGRSYGHHFAASKVWDQLVEMDDGSLIELTRALAKKHLIGFFDYLPLEDVLAAIMRKKPEAGAQIWQEVRTRQRSSNMASGEVTLMPFTMGEHEALVALRKGLLSEAKSDADINVLVRAAIDGKHEAWLVDECRKLLAGNVEEIAAAITIASFLDMTNATEALWTDIRKLELSGWLAEVRSIAGNRISRTLWARHWFDVFVKEKDPDIAYGYLALFVDCAGRRAFNYARTCVNDAHHSDIEERWRVHLDATADARRQMVKKNADERGRVLYATAKVDWIAPWY